MTDTITTTNPTGVTVETGGEAVTFRLKDGYSAEDRAHALYAAAVEAVAAYVAETGQDFGQVLGDIAENLEPRYS